MLCFCRHTDAYIRMKNQQLSSSNNENCVHHETEMAQTKANTHTRTTCDVNTMKMKIINEKYITIRCFSSALFSSAFCVHALASFVPHFFRHSDLISIFRSWFLFCPLSLDSLMHRLMWMCYLFSAMQWHFCISIWKAFCRCMRIRSTERIASLFSFCLAATFTKLHAWTQWAVLKSKRSSRRKFNANECRVQRQYTTHHRKLNEMDDWIFTTMSSHYSLEIRIFPTMPLFCIFASPIAIRPKLFCLFTNRFLRTFKSQTGEMTFKMKQANCYQRYWWWWFDDDENGKTIARKWICSQWEHRQVIKVELKMIMANIKKVHGGAKAMYSRTSSDFLVKAYFHWIYYKKLMVVSTGVQHQTIFVLRTIKIMNVFYLKFGSFLPINIIKSLLGHFQVPNDVQRKCCSGAKCRCQV